MIIINGRENIFVRFSCTTNKELLINQVRNLVRRYYILRVP